jgi:hypothetical protein
VDTRQKNVARQTKKHRKNERPTGNARATDRATDRPTDRQIDQPKSTKYKIGKGRARWDADRLAWKYCILSLLMSARLLTVVSLTSGGTSRTGKKSFCRYRSSNAAVSRQQVMSDQHEAT